MAKVTHILAAEKVNLTSGRIAAFECPKGTLQTFLWCDDPLGLAVRAYPSGSKSFIYQTKINKKSVRLSIGDVGTWSIAAAKAEARRLQTLIDQGEDPRQVKAAKSAALKAKAAEIIQKQVYESLTVAEAWQQYIANRSVAMKKGKKLWGERYKIDLERFVSAGGLKRTRGRRPNEPETTRPGILYPLMKMKLVDLDAKAVQSWFSIEAEKAPTNTAKAFRALSSFIAWCSKQEDYNRVVHADACKAEEVKNQVPAQAAKPNDCLRKAQIKPWFEAVQKIGNPVISAYLQCLLLTGARRNELAGLRWGDVDFQWKSLTIRDKIEGTRTIPLTPYVERLIATLPRRNEFVFSSPTSKSGRLEEPRLAHNQALRAAALPELSLHGLRRSFDTLSEYAEVPVGAVAQIMGHKPSAIAEKHYIQRELDLLHIHHVKIEAWILEQAGIEFVPVQAGLQLVKSNAV